MEADLSELFLTSAQQRLGVLKRLGEQAMAQLSDADLHWTPDTESNSIGVIIQHLHGNMLSRWTNFLSSDGEKPWRHRDNEFELDPMLTRQAIVELWEEGWASVFKTLGELEPHDLAKEITIRGQSLSVLDAIHRQMTHYGYHVGQIVYVAKTLASNSWRSLSIPRAESRQYVPRQQD